METATTDSFKDRFRSVVEELGGSKPFSERTKVSYSATRKYLSGSEPTRAVLSKIVQSCDVDPFWLLTGIDSKQRITTKHPNTPTKATDRDDSLIIPYFNYNEYEKILAKNLDFRARDKAIAELTSSGTTSGGFPLRKSRIEYYQLNDTENLFCYVMQDNSMAPEIPIGSDLIINLARKSLESGKNYLLRYEGNPVIRKAIRDSEEGIWTLAGNSKENTFTTSLQKLDENNCVIGLVSYAFKKLG